MDGDQPITMAYWASLSQQEQSRIITAEDEEAPAPCPPLPAGYEHLIKYHGLFPCQHGANCFAAVLYAISGQHFLLGQWVHQQAFLLFLERGGYKQVEGDAFCAGDALCFYQEDKLVHACFAVDSSHCFNKNGQTFWERWAIVPFSRISEDFEGCMMQPYRRQAR